jgi:hypothetical protein
MQQNNSPTNASRRPHVRVHKPYASGTEQQQSRQQHTSKAAAQLLPHAFGNETPAPALACTLPAPRSQQTAVAVAPPPPASAVAQQQKQQQDADILLDASVGDIQAEQAVLLQQPQQQQYHAPAAAAAASAHPLPPPPPFAQHQQQPTTTNFMSQREIDHTVSEIARGAHSEDDFKRKAGSFQQSFIARHTIPEGRTHIHIPEGSVESNVIEGIAANTNRDSAVRYLMNLSKTLACGAALELYNYIAHQPVFELVLAQLVYCVMYPTMLFYQSFAAQHKHLEQDSIIDPAKLRPGQVCLFVGGLPCFVTHMQLFSLFYILCGITPVAIKIHRSKEGQDATSAWVVVASEEQARRAIALLNKSVVFDCGCWHVCAGSWLARQLFRVFFELRRTDEDARYQRLAFLPITVMRTNRGSTSNGNAPCHRGGATEQRCEHDPLCPCGSCQSMVPDFSHIERYLATPNAALYDPFRTAGISAHSNSPGRHVPNGKALDLSNRRFRQVLTAHISRGVAVFSCDARRLVVPYAAHFYHVDSLWNDLQTMLRSARRAVKDRCEEERKRREYYNNQPFWNRALVPPYYQQNQQQQYHIQQNQFGSPQYQQQQYHAQQ